ncbi:MAG: hypothetical protein GXP45_06150, partial [bacterium]|nr:hypothetical protein [bacterium]
MVNYFTPGKPDPSFDFITKIKKFKTEFDYQKYDTLLFLDFTDYIRIEKFTKDHEEYFDKGNLIIIDHHIGDIPHTCKTYYKDTHALSSCDIVFEFLERRDQKNIDKEIANDLYLGITTDSGNFTFGDNEQSIRILHNASKLIHYGADKANIIQNVFYQQSFTGLHFIQKLIQRSKIKGKILYTYYNIKDLHKYKIDAEQAKLFFNSIITKVYG